MTKTSNYIKNLQRISINQCKKGTPTNGHNVMKMAFKKEEGMLTSQTIRIM